MTSHVTRLGLQMPIFNFPDVGPEGLLDKLGDIASTAENSGFDSVWVMDHLHQIPPVGPPDMWMLEGNTALAAIAARTRKASVGLMVGGVTYRNPALHAKVTTTIDVLSGGRAIHGIGAAWFEDEHVAYGYRFPPISERFERLEDHLNIARAMFTQEKATYEGKHHSVNGALNYPRPVRGDIPIMVGGSGKRKTLRMVAQYADASNVFGSPDEIRGLMDILDQHCENVGRDPKEITRTRLGTLIIGRTHEEAERKLDAVLGDRPARASAISGDPDTVAEKVSALQDAGLDGQLFVIPDSFDLEVLELAGKTLRGAIGD